MWRHKQRCSKVATTIQPAAPMPARISAWAIYDVFETQDEPIFIGVVTDALWEKFCALFGLDSLWADITLRENNARVAARDRIIPIIRELISRFTRAEVIARAARQPGCPLRPYRDTRKICSIICISANSGLEQVTLVNGQTTQLPTLPLEMEGCRLNSESKLGEPGADAQTVLALLDYTPDRIQKLIDSKAVG
ncbi:MAG: CoA transferase [Parasphingorhabdus sp.]|nr:CoA transferase [Parasphingorhabdus sp.]